MSQDQRKNSGAPDEPMRKPALIGALLLALVGVGAVIVYKNRGGNAAAAPAESVAVADVSPPTRLQSPPPAVTNEAEEVATPQDSPPSPPSTGTLAAMPAKPFVPPTAPRPEPSPYTRELVTALSKIDLSRGEVTPELAAAWKQSLQQLTQRGAESVPAIREFLEKNLDLSFDAAKNGTLLGQPSLRLSMLEALQQIGGPEALALSLDTLRSSSEPREIAWLAKMLEQQAPEQYRLDVVNAAREVLAQAAGGKLDGRDVGPLFSVLQQYGGADVLSDLEKTRGAWRYYSAIALADMPNGLGVPSLIQMAQDPSTSNSRLGLQMLAQVATQFPEARTALFEQLRSTQIPEATWMTIADVLAGDRYQIGAQVIDPLAPPAGGTKSFHLNFGNQNFYSTLDTRGWTEEQFNQRVQLIDQVLASNPTQVAMDALKRSRERLLLARPKL